MKKQSRLEEIILDYHFNPIPSLVRPVTLYDAIYNALLDEVIDQLVLSPTGSEYYRGKFEGQVEMKHLLRQKLAEFCGRDNDNKA